MRAGVVWLPAANQVLLKRHRGGLGLDSLCVATVHGFWTADPERCAGRRLAFREVPPPPCPADGTGTAEASSGLVRSPSQYTPRKRPTRPSLARDTPPPGTAKRPRLALSVVGTYRPADTSDVCERLVWNRVYRGSACNHS